MLDRIDIQIEVPAVSAVDLTLPPPKRGSADVRARVLAARKIQKERYNALGLEKVRCNSECANHVLEDIAKPDKKGESLLCDAADALRLSARGYHRTLKLARTLADLDGQENVGRIHIAEALSYRGETLSRKVAA